MKKNIYDRWWIPIVIMLALFTAIAMGAAPAKPAPGDIVPFQPIFKQVAGPMWVARAAQAKAESGFDPMAVSMVVGKDKIRRPCAYGLVQFTPPTWAIWGKGGNPYDPAAAIPAEHGYMNWLAARTHGNLDLATASYNTGLGNIQKALRLVDSLGLPGEDAWMGIMPRVTGVANAKQTTDYVKRIRVYRAQIGAQVKP